MTIYFCGCDHAKSVFKIGFNYGQVFDLHEIIRLEDRVAILINADPDALVECGSDFGDFVLRRLKEKFAAPADRGYIGKDSE